MPRQWDKREADGGQGNGDAKRHRKDRGTQEEEAEKYRMARIEPRTSRGECLEGQGALPGPRTAWIGTIISVKAAAKRRVQTAGFSKKLFEILQ